MRAPCRVPFTVISLTLAACGQINAGFTPDPGPSLATIHINPSQGVVPRGGVHSPGWDGWLRVDGADGHASVERGTAMAVTVRVHSDRST